MGKSTMIHCEELQRLSDESSALFSEYLAVRDDFKLTKKSDAAYLEKAKSLKRIQGQLGEAHRKFQQHIKDHGCR